jgi:predicted transcriptional regulator
MTITTTPTPLAGDELTAAIRQEHAAASAAAGAALAHTRETTKAWRLSQLGWTQAEIGERLSVTQSVVSTDIGNSQLGKINNDLGDHWNDKGVAEKDKNVFREPFKPSEMVALGKTIEEFHRPIAEAAKAEGKKEGGKNRHSSGGNSPKAKQPRDESKRTSSVAAAACGVARRTYEKAKVVAHRAFTASCRGSRDIGGVAVPMDVAAERCQCRARAGGGQNRMGEIPPSDQAHASAGGAKVKVTYVTLTAEVCPSRRRRRQDIKFTYVNLRAGGRSVGTAHAAKVFNEKDSLPEELNTAADESAATGLSTATIYRQRRLKADDAEDRCEVAPTSSTTPPWTQKRIATLLGVAQNTVSDWFSNIGSDKAKSQPKGGRSSLSRPSLAVWALPQACFDPSFVVAAYPLTSCFRLCLALSGRVLDCIGRLQA